MDINPNDFIDYEFERVSKDTDGYIEVVSPGFEKDTDFYTVYGRLIENPAEVVALVDCLTEDEAINLINQYQDGASKTCEWFLLCENPATTTMHHPILGDVPICQRCIDKINHLNAI